MLEPVIQQHPVGQISQRIVVRHVLDLDLGLALLGDVFMRRDPAAAGHRAVTDLERASVHQFDDAVFRLVGNRHVGAPVKIFIARHGGEAAGFERRSTISISDMPGLTRSGAISYISTKRSLQTIRRWSESKKHSPCDMLLMAVSNWKFLTRSVSSCSLPSSYCFFSRILSSSRSVMSSWVAIPPPPGTG